MSTRSSIGVIPSARRGFHKDCILATYVHWDGYPSHMVTTIVEDIRPPISIGNPGMQQGFMKTFICDLLGSALVGGASTYALRTKLPALHLPNPPHHPVEAGYQSIARPNFSAIGSAGGAHSGQSPAAVGEAALVQPLSGQPPAAGPWGIESYATRISYSELDSLNIHLAFDEIAERSPLSALAIAGTGRGEKHTSLNFINKWWEQVCNDREYSDPNLLTLRAHLFECGQEWAYLVDEDSGKIHMMVTPYRTGVGPPSNEGELEDARKLYAEFLYKPPPPPPPPQYGFSLIGQ
jgi:hypothetical protein